MSTRISDSADVDAHARGGDGTTVWDLAALVEDGASRAPALDLLHDARAGSLERAAVPLELLDEDSWRLARTGNRYEQTDEPPSLESER